MEHEGKKTNMGARKAAETGGEHGVTAAQAADRILIGKITSAVGLKGEVKVYNYSDSARIYVETPEIYVGDTLHAVAGVRTQKGMVILRFEDVTDRDGAEKLRGREVFVTEDDLPELEEGEYYVRDLIGMSVVTDGAERVATDAPGHILGTLTDVIQNTAQDLFEIRTEAGKTVLIPRVDAYVKDIDADRRVITVHLQEGILDL